MDVVQKFRKAWLVGFSATKQRTTYVVGLQVLIIKVVVKSSYSSKQKQKRHLLVRNIRAHHLKMADL